MYEHKQTQNQPRKEKSVHREEQEGENEATGAEEKCENRRHKNGKDENEKCE